jgi:hypothetical protein
MEVNERPSTNPPDYTFREGRCAFTARNTVYAIYLSPDGALPQRISLPGFRPTRRVSDCSAVMRRLTGTAKARWRNHSGFDFQGARFRLRVWDMMRRSQRSSWGLRSARPSPYPCDVNLTTRCVHRATLQQTLVTSLTKDDFEVFEDGVSQTISFLRGAPRSRCLSA